MPRFFVEPENITENNIKIIGEELRHIKDVLRLGINSELTIGDGQGLDYRVSISEIDKDYIIANIIDKKPSVSEPNLKITMFQSLIKGDRFEWAIQKAVEIGVYEIVPIQTAYCVVKIDNAKKSKSKLERWNKIAKSAAKQSGRGIVPIVSEPISYKEAIERASKQGMGIIAYEKEDSVNLKEVLKDFKEDNLGIIIGPEGGFSEDEIQLATDNNIKTITLGKRILRSETAGLVLSANILYERE